jgi:hypothetical protein
MENYKEYFEKILDYSKLELVNSNKRGYLKDREQDIYVKQENDKMGIIAVDKPNKKNVKIVVERDVIHGGKITITMDDDGEKRKSITDISERYAIIVKASKKRIVAMIHTDDQFMVCYPDRSKNRILTTKEFSVDELSDEIVNGIINSYDSINWVFEMTELSNILKAIFKVFVKNMELGWKESLKTRENSLKEELLSTAYEVKKVSERYYRVMERLNRIHEANEVFYEKDNGRNK